MNKFFIICFALSGCLAATKGQNFNKPKLDSLFNILSQKNKAMGSFVLYKNQTVLYNKVIGYSCISDKEHIPANTSSKYRIGSITKMFTAAIVFQLIEEGKISLTTKLDSYFPALPNAKTITIGNMLNHRSGLHNFTDDSTYNESWRSTPKTHEEIINIIAKHGADFLPDKQSAYSNSNYVVLGYIIEKVCKKPYKNILQERITSKIGLSDTYVGGTIDVHKNECNSYLMKDNWRQLKETDMSIPGGAGSIVSTPLDLAQFITALFNGKLVSLNSLKKMEEITDGYGMGLFKMPFYTRMAFGHTGGIDGFESFLAYFPDDSIAVAYCTNGVVYPENDILIRALSIFYSMPCNVPKFEAISLQTKDLDKYLGTYSSSQLPLKICVTKKDTVLITQATGQEAITLEADSKDQFKFYPAGIEIDFAPDGSSFTLKQGGGNYLYKKEKQN